MAVLEVNGKAVLAIRLTHPLSGVWVATLEADTDEPLAGSVKLIDDDVTLAATVVSSAVFGGTCRADLIGGAGGFPKELDSRSYLGNSARSIISDLLAGVGERLDASSTPAVLGTPLAYWTRAKGRAGTALATLSDKLAANWRVLPSGATWFGRETWPKAAPSLKAPILDQSGADGTVLLAPDSIALRPGVTLGGVHVGRVEHHFSRHSPLRTTFWIEP